jgi:hypothetical protein
MLLRAIDVRVNPSDETIRVGPLAVRFLITAENSNDSVAAFELGSRALRVYRLQHIATTTMKRRSTASTEC